MDETVARVKEVMEHSGLSPSEFADRIGVNRASVSHILSGRNRPSLGFIQQLLASFTNVNSEWLLAGRGEAEKKSQEQNGGQKPQRNKRMWEEDEEPTHQQVAAPTDTQEEQQARYEQRSADAPAQDQIPQSKEVDYILVCYKDGTFERLMPR